MSAPPAPLPGFEETFPVADGLALHLERFLPDGAPSVSVVVVHGFSSYCGLYRHVATALAREGAAVTLFDCRGHGRSPGRRGYVRRFSDFVDDLEAAVARTRAAVPDVPLVLMGHSHGGLIVVDYALGAGRRLDGIALAAPFFALQIPVPRMKLALGKLMSRVWPTLTMDNEIRPQNVSREPEVIAGFASDPYVHHVATPRWFREVMTAQARVMAAASTLEVPCLVQVVGEDRIVSTEAALAFARSVGPTAEVKRYDGLYHELFLEPERDRVIGDLAAWVMARARPARILQVSP